MTGQSGAFETFKSSVQHEFSSLQNENKILLDKLKAERKRHKITQEELSEERLKPVLKCMICYMQPNKWRTLACGHLLCELCTKSLFRKACPYCNAPWTRYIKCYPFV